MSQKVVAVVVALVAAVVAFVVSGNFFKGGTSLRPTTKPKLERGFGPWESWKNHAFIGFPPTYVEYVIGSASATRFAGELEESLPGMKDKLDVGIGAPDHVLTAFELNPAHADSYVDHFTIFYKKGWPKMTLERFIAAMKKDASKTFPGSKNVSAEEVDHPNGKVAKVEYDTIWERKEQKPVPLRVINYVFINGDDAHLLTFTTLKDRLDKVRPVFDKAFGTFRVTK